MGDHGSVRALGATFLFACITAGGAWAALAAPGCALSNCDPAYENSAQVNLPGDMLDSTTWESSPIEATWHAFLPQHTYEFRLPQFAPDKYQPHVSDVLVFLSVQEDPPNNPDGTQGLRTYAIGAGNIAEINTNGDPTYFQVHNDSCATYFFRVVVHAYPIPPVSAVDAGIDAEIEAGTGTLDAGTTDAPLDVADAGPIDASATD